ncbi:MAG: AMP-binding protein [Dehalococcoidales bacterium]
MPIDGFIEPNKEDAEKYTSRGWWEGITVADILDKAAESHPDKEALADGLHRFTYSQLRDKADRLAVGLLKTGIKRGDVVMVQLPNWAEFAIAFFALHKIGAPAVLILPRHMQLEINHLCGMTRAKAWILPVSYRKTDYLPIIKAVRKANPHLEHIISVRSGKDSPFTSFEDLIEKSDLSPENMEAISKNRPDPGTVAIVLATGGTTGLPKAVPRTHNSLVCETRYKTEARRQDSTDTCLIAVPLEHNLGLAGLESTVYSCGRTVLLDSTKPEDFCETIEKEKVTRAPIVPTMLTRLAGYSGLDRYDLSSLQALYVGGAKTQPEVIESIYTKIGKVYVSAFGMSEGPSCTTHLDDDPDIIFNTIGKSCCPHDVFMTVDENGNKTETGAEGELLVKGPGLFSGYLNNPEENKRAFTSEGYFRTGDLASIDSEGNVRITGRIKDIIIRGGENISPAEMETLIIQHPGVEEVVVIGLPDDELGEKACACIIPANGPGPTLEDIVGFLKSSGASVLQLPERVETISEVPLTKIGKPDKIALRKTVIALRS